jgi:hypothetical protein
MEPKILLTACFLLILGSEETSPWVGSCENSRCGWKLVSGISGRPSAALAGENRADLGLGDTFLIEKGKKRV